MIDSLLKPTGENTFNKNTLATKWTFSFARVPCWAPFLEPPLPTRSQRNSQDQLFQADLARLEVRGECPACLPGVFMTLEKWLVTQNVGGR